MNNPRKLNVKPSVITGEFIKKQNLSHVDAEWLRHRLRLLTDNVFLYNITSNPINLSLYEWDGKNWKDQPITLLKQHDSAWVTLKPLGYGTGTILGQEPQIVGQSILIVRPNEIQKGKCTFWRVDNISQMPLYAAVFSGALSCSRTSECQLLWSCYAPPKKSITGNLTIGLDCDPVDAHWEYWFHDPLIDFDKP